MAGYSEKEAREASRIVERLLDPEQGIAEVESGVVVSDIESDAAEFATDLQLLARLGLKAPAARLGKEDLIPVALSLIARPSWPFSLSLWGPRSHMWPGPVFDDWAKLYLRSQLEDGERFRTFETLALEQARMIFVKRATDFLATRITAVRDFAKMQALPRSGISFLNVLQYARGPRVSTPGCNFSVSTNSKGLRVFWSGAYRVSPNYFSHPTTPAVGVLQSGTYVFGIDGGAYGNQIQWDLNAVVTLPGTPHTHLNY